MIAGPTRVPSVEKRENCETLKNWRVTKKTHPRTHPMMKAMDRTVMAMTSQKETVAKKENKKKNTVRKNAHTRHENTQWNIHQHAHRINPMTAW